MNIPTLTSQTIVIEKLGGPEVMQFKNVTVGDPGADGKWSCTTPSKSTGILES